MGHTYSTFGPYGTALINNANIFRGEWVKDGAFAAVINAFPSVDTFFIIGATLLTFLTLKELDKLANKGASVGESAFFWMKYYVHRYIRLTGVYACILLFHASLLKLFATGPQSEWMMMNVDACQEDWWKNLLYINNFSFTGRGCMGQTWYLAVEMQCFIITPLLIWPLWRFPKVGLGLVSAGFLACKTFACIFETLLNLTFLQRRVLLLAWPGIETIHHQPCSNSQMTGTWRTITLFRGSESSLTSWVWYLDLFYTSSETQKSSK